MAAKFRCFQKVMKDDDEVEIREVFKNRADDVRQFLKDKAPSQVKYRVRKYLENGRFFDYPNVSENDLREIPKPHRNEILDFVAAANLFKKNGKEA